jgi:hypothetical protein
MERGLNENTNGLIRDFFPKGTDFSTIANAEVAKVERLLNARPRKSLGFRSQQHVTLGVVSVGENSDLRYCWDDLSKQLEAPSPDFQARIDADTRQVPARMRQARYQSIVNRIATDRDYRDSRSRLPQGRYHPRGKRKHNIEIAAYDRLHERGIFLDVTFT